MAQRKDAKAGIEGAVAGPADPAATAPTDTAQPATKGLPGLPLPRPSAGTNLVIADIVLRAAGGLLRDRLERGLIVTSDGPDKAAQWDKGRGVAASLVLWGASRLARRSPLGLAVVAGGLAAKVVYDRGKRLEQRRSKPGKPPAKS
jgi:hypothetical protein